MSRCFPFPPPGYEKKTRSDDVDLQIKDKKEKKQKKEKRDKKKDDKNKEDKERNKDKDRKKKDRKEKHKDKKKSKDREKKNEKRIDGHPEGTSGEKHSENHQQAEAIRDTQFMEIGWRVTDEERGRRDQMVENLHHQDQMAGDLPCRDQIVVNLPHRDQMLENLLRREQRVENVPRQDQMVEKLPCQDQILENLPHRDSRNEDLVDKLVAKYFDSGFEDNEKVKDKDEHDRKPDKKTFKDEGRVMENTVFSSFVGAEQRRVGGTARPMENKGGQSLRVDGRVTEKTVIPSFTAADQRRVGVAPKAMDNKDGHDKKTERHKVKSEGKVTEDTTVPSFSSAEQRKVGSIARPEKETERKMEGKEKNKDLAGSEKQVKKHKYRDGEKNNKYKKAAEKEKMKEIVKHENKKQDMMIEIPDDHIDTLNIKPIQIPKDTEKSGSGGENLKKRKDCESNGFLHEHDVRPNKLPRPTLSPHPLILNGRKTEPSQHATLLASAMPMSPSNIKFDNKGIKVNGLIQAQPTSINLTSRSIPPVQTRENGEASRKSPPPHPDSKYLNQILTVPKVDDWSNFDDQEWLFSSDSLQEKKPKVVSSGVDGLPQVWDRAVRIDSADVCALPYVIPY